MKNTLSCGFSSPAGFPPQPKAVSNENCELSRVKRVNIKRDFSANDQPSRKLARKMFVFSCALRPGMPWQTSEGQVAQHEQRHENQSGTSSSVALLAGAMAGGTPHQ